MQVNLEFYIIRTHERPGTNSLHKPNSLGGQIVHPGLFNVMNILTAINKEKRSKKEKFTLTFISLLIELYVFYNTNGGTMKCGGNPHVT